MTLRQNDPRWGSILLGDGPSTIGRSGCLLVCLTESVRLLTDRHDALPPHLNEELRQCDCFLGAALVVHEAARVLNLESPRNECVMAPHGSPDLADAVETALAKGHALIHVDHDSQREDGDPEGDHFILAVGFAKPDGMPMHVECYDPATGIPTWLSWPDLRATVRWGKAVKSYRAVSVRPIRRRA